MRALCCVVCTRHMFEVEQIDYDKEQIDWSYITFNDNKVRHFQIIQSIKIIQIIQIVQNIQHMEIVGDVSWLAKLYWPR